MPTKSKTNKSPKKAELIRVSVYFESTEVLDEIKQAASKVQLRNNPNISGYIAQAVLERVKQDLAGGQQ